MSDTNDNNRLDRIEQIQESNARAIAAIQEVVMLTAQNVDRNSQSINDLTANVQNLTNDVDRVLARSAILDDVLLGLHGNQQRYEGKTDEIMEKLDQILERLNKN